MQRSDRWVGAALVLASLALGAQQGLQAASVQSEPSKLEPIEGTGLSRVTLTAEAIKRLELQTGPVREEPVARKRKVMGEVVEPGHVLPLAQASSADAVVRARLTGDASGLALDQPARVWPLGHDASADSLEAQPLIAPSIDIVKDAPGAPPVSPVSVQSGDGPTPAAASGDPLYLVAGKGGDVLSPGDRVLIEVADRQQVRKVVPEGAVVFDPHGEAWVYTNPEPLVFIRHAVEIDRINGDGTVALTDGPPAGTVIVTVGAPMLLGTEFEVGH
jgi:hypothetical protein